MPRSIFGLVLASIRDLLPVLLLAGCPSGGDALTPDSADEDAGAHEDSEDAEADVGEAEREADVEGDGADEVTPAPCETPLEGGEPFAKLLVGEADFVFEHASPPRAPVHASAGIRIYFPEGRRSGAEVVAAHPISWPRAGLVVDRETLDGSGEADLAVGGSGGGDFYVRGRLLGPDGGFLAHVAYNYADYSSDVTEMAVADLMFCATSDVAAPTLSFPGLPGSRGVAGPLSTIWLAPDSPLADETPDIAVTADGDPVAVEVALDGGAVHITATGAFPPGRSLAVALADVTDVIGRPVSLSGEPPQALHTTASIADLELDSVPPDGAVAGDGRVSGGFLRIGRGDPWGRFAALVALGTPPTDSTVARLLVHLECEGPTAPGLALVSADGVRRDLDLECGAGFVELASALPDAGPVWLAAAYEPDPPRPQWLNPPVSAALTIDWIRFE